MPVAPLPRQLRRCRRPPPAPLGPLQTPPLADIVKPVAYHEPLPERSELSLPELTAEVQARNPSVQAMVAAWQAASQRYPQVVSLDDPMFGFMLGTEGLGHDGGWMVMASQKIPWCGKRALRGEIAQAEADAAGREVDDVRLRLAEATAAALADYYQARRELEINAANVELMTQFREIAKVRYETNQVSEQDVLQADLELAELESRRAEIVREEKVAVARINTLLHLPADSPLPPPPKQLDRPRPSRRRPRRCSVGRSNSGPTWPPRTPASAPTRRRWLWPTRSSIPTWRWWPSTTPSCPRTCGRKWG